MPLLITILGIAVTLVALVTIILNGKRVDKSLISIEKHEAEIRELRREVEKNARDFRASSDEAFEKLEKRVKDINRAGTMVDSKMKEAQGILKILENTIEKSSNIEIDKREVKKEKKNLSKSEIVELYKKGMSIKDISIKSGKSLKEIQIIMGL